MIPQRPLGSTALQVSILGYGGAPIGFSDSRGETNFISLLRGALDLGINFFDTAPDYRHSEEFIGKALLGHRHDVVLATKCGRIQTWHDGAWQVSEDWSAVGIQRTIENSLSRLQTDYLDLVQLHSPPLWVLDQGEALQGLIQARDAGKVRHIGVSADGAEAWRALELGVFSTLQVSYSILQQEPGNDLLPAAAAVGMGLIIKQPLANGIPDMRERPSHPDWSWKWDVAQRMNWPPSSGLDSRLGLSLRWLLANPLVSTAIVGTTNLTHLQANSAEASLPALDPTAAQQIKDDYKKARQEIAQEQAL